MDASPDIAATVAVAHALMGDGDAAAATEELTAALARTDAITAVQPHPEVDAMVCVDGALAIEHSDALAWIAAVATDSTHTTLRTKTAVAPISSTVDAFSSAVMALCEMSIAREVCDEVGHAWMDGGLVTPLLSVVTGLLIEDRDTNRILCDVLADVDGAGIIEDYLHFATCGQIAALPKQDTAATFCAHWRSSLDGLAPPTRAWLGRQRDRTVAGLLLAAGHMLAPRPGVEALRVEAKIPPHADPRAEDWLSGIEELLADWRAEVKPAVTYLAPTAATTGRATKIEFTYTDDVDRDQMAALRAAQVDAGIVGSRVIEPVAQYAVDRHAKTEVKGLLAELLTAADSAFAQSPSAVRRYRT